MQRSENGEKTATFERIRRIVNRNMVVTVVVVSGLILTALLVSLRDLSPSRPTAAVGNTALYDEDSNEIVRVSDDSLHGWPPFANKDGKATLVVPVYFTCDTCANRKIVYLQKCSDKGREAFNAYLAAVAAAPHLPSRTGSSEPGPVDPKATLPPALFQKTYFLVRSLEKGSPWVRPDSSAGQKITAPPICPDGKPAEQPPCPQ